MVDISQSISKELYEKISSIFITYNIQTIVFIL